jgi:hypothetical protein
MKNCTYCGRENPDDAAGCRECGTVFVTEPDNSQASGPRASAGLARTAAEKRMLSGALWFLGGILVTVLSYGSAASSPSGGTYVIAWGAIVFGALRFFQGLSGRDTQPSSEDIGYYELACGTKLEREGHVREALLVYQRIIEKYPQTDVGRDAKKSIESLQAKIG